MKSRGRKKRKSGSALLVVLGFLSFMVVSAVAFAIYMRTERVPSSAFRRNTATRHLVKAALAQAMSRVDDAIRNDPFPGLANTNGNNYASFYHDADNNSMDLWLGRVFMPPDPAGLVDDNGANVVGANEPGDMNKFPWRFAPVTETVSVLNLEALGYLPPPLVNDVRFLSRSSWTARWQNFAFDAGRFAFCAVNVSDYFDINRTRVGVRSSPLDSPISLRGTLTWRPENNQVEDVSESAFKGIGNLLGPNAKRQTSNENEGNAGGAEDSTEYASMLDYNLAFGYAPGGISCLSPLFYDWVYNNGGSRKYFYGGTIRTATDAIKARRQPFIADSFATNETYEIDFATLAGQPFSDIDMKGNLTVQDVGRSGSECVKRMLRKGLIGEVDPYTLYDYLDHDDVPLSLAMPSVECVPMVTGVNLVKTGRASLMVRPPQDPKGNVVQKPGPGETGLKITEKTYTLDPLSFKGGVGVNVLVSFPFRHTKGRNDDFKVQVAMKVFVAAGEVPIRPTGDLANLYPKSDTPKTEWDATEQPKVFGDTGDMLVWSFYSDKISVDIPDECEKQSDAVFALPLIKDWRRSSQGAAGDQKFFTEIEEQQVSISEDGTEKIIGPPVKAFRFDLRPYRGGMLVQSGRQEGDYAALYPDEFKVYTAVWVRITNSAGDETYDLAPAIMSDDRLNSKNSNFVIVNNVGGAAPGWLKFVGDRAYTYGDLGTLNKEDNLDWSPKALATADPRFNYAPEDWFVWDQPSMSGGDWLSAIAGAGLLNADDGHDPDIFMFTSNQGYLQSLGEFAFLPRLSESSDHPSGPIRTLVKNAPGAGAWKEYATDPQEVLNNQCVWRTYPVDRLFYENCARPDVGIGRSLDGSQTVNPYSDDEAVLMAAFAETPCDYWTTGRIVAGAKSRGEALSAEFQKIVDKMGDKNEASGDAIKDAKDCLKNAFCEENDDKRSSMMTVENVKEIMRSFAREFSAGGGRPWEEVYDDLPWFDGLDPNAENSFKNFMGVTLNKCPLFSVDRKFLYSYWRDCFANKQQLFLIFVRAESTALGGPGEGTPSQQGGRAVALVWREPTSFNDGNNPNGTYPDSLASQAQRQRFYQGRRPHRMRVLFYHQFD